MKKVKCMTCGNIQEENFFLLNDNKCQKCNTEMDKDNRSEELNKKTKNDIRLSSKLTKEQKEFIEGFSLGGFVGAGLGGIVFVFIYNAIVRRTDNMEDWEWLSFIPVVNFYVALKLGIEGRKLSWEKGRWTSYEEFAGKHGNADIIIPVIIIFIIFIKFAL